MNSVQTNQSGAVARRIGPVSVQVLSRRQALDVILSRVASGAAEAIGFCNAHTVNLARSSAPFQAALAQMTLLNDGIGLDLASKLLYGEPFRENLNGTDFSRAVLGALPAGTRVFLLGSEPGVAEQALRRLSHDFPAVTFVGARDGYFPAAQGGAVADEIASTGAQLVLVGMGQPRQELWAVEYAVRANALMLCIGAFLDFSAGKFPRAPKIVQKARMEWAFRLAQEPRRLFGRYVLGNARFLAFVIAQRLQAQR